jgi:hypothetical protein
MQPDKSILIEEFLSLFKTEKLNKCSLAFMNIFLLFNRSI